MNSIDHNNGTLDRITTQVTYQDNSSTGIDPIAVRPGMILKPLDKAEIVRIHQATLSLLEKTGVKFPSMKALSVFAEAGAQVDFTNQVVRIPSDLLMSCIAKAPRTIRMASRSRTNLDLYLDGTKSYYGNVGTGVSTVDILAKIRKRKASTKEDVAKMALISDYLSSISFYWPSVCAQDVPPAVLSLHELEATITNTEKHNHIINCSDGRTASYAVEIASLIAGGNQAVRSRPPFSLYVATFSPLSQIEGLIDAALIFADAGLPVIIGAPPMVGLSAPCSMLGALLLGNAEILGILCLVQLVHPGAPVCYAFFHDMINPITGKGWSNGPQKSIFQACANQLGHHYNLPVMCGCGSTNDFEPGKWQSGKDYAIDAFTATFSGADLVASMGLLDTYALLYPEKILFDDDIFQSVKAMAEGIRVDSDTTLVMNEIREVGHEGNFLDRDYTIQNIRKLWQPGICNQWSSQIGDFRDPLEVAVEKIKWILNNHRPKPLDEKVRKELSRIILAAEGELIN